MFVALALGDVPGQGDIPIVPPLHVADANLSRKAAAVLALQYVFKSCLMNALQLSEDSTQIVLIVTRGQLVERLGQQLFAAVAEVEAGMAVYVEQGAVAVEKVKRVGGIFDQEPEALLALPQHPLPLLAFADVEAYPDQAGRHSGGVGIDLLVKNDVAVASVGVAELSLVDLVFAALPQRAVGAIVDLGPFRVEQLEHRAPDDVVAVETDVIQKCAVAADIAKRRILVEDRAGDGFKQILKKGQLVLQHPTPDHHVLEQFADRAGQLTQFVELLIGSILEGLLVLDILTDMPRHLDERLRKAEGDPTDEQHADHRQHAEPDDGEQAHLQDRLNHFGDRQHRQQGPVADRDVAIAADHLLPREHDPLEFAALARR